MNILLLNWRDPQHPRSGGAEKLNCEILKAFIEKGNSVTWYSLAVKGLPKREVYQNITIIRHGNILTHFLAWPFYLYSNKFGKVDFIIDSIHGIGYCSNVIAPFIKRRVLICEVAQNIWDEMISFPLNIVGKLLEPVMLFMYRNNRFWTISQSTKKDLETLYIPSKNILVLPMGFDAPSLTKVYDKYKNPTALFVGRLAEMKGIRDAIQAIVSVNKKARISWRLQIIGKGDPAYESRLKQLVSSLDATQYIKFLGYVSQQKKFQMMAESWVLLVPSSREGWGMIVAEANFVKTQVIAYRSPGLTDSVVLYNKKNILVDNTIDSLVSAIQSIKRPVVVAPQIDGGWDALHKTVLHDLMQQ